MRHIKILGQSEDELQLLCAMLLHEKGAIIVDLPWPHAINKSILNLLMKIGAKIDLGCDPCMTREGKYITALIESIEQEMRRTASD